MGQLDVYSLDDISLITIMAGPISSYLSEEIEVSIENISAYIYSSNITSKKRNKLTISQRLIGNMVEEVYTTWYLLGVHSDNFFSVHRSLDYRIM
jgi:hypothetical protein